MMTKERMSDLSFMLKMNEMFERYLATLKGKQKTSFQVQIDRIHFQIGKAIVDEYNPEDVKDAGVIIEVINKAIANHFNKP